MTGQTGIIRRLPWRVNQMSNGGRVTVAFKQQFWGDIYGNFTDRFGVQWAVVCQPKA